MQTAIVYYSLTRHTQSFMDQLSKTIPEGVPVFRLEPQAQPNLTEIRTPLKQLPDISQYQTIIIASPVHGGRPPAALMTFLEDTSDFSGKQITLFATHFLPAKWGCNQMFDQIQSLIESKGGKVSAFFGIRWTSLQRKKLIADGIKRISLAISKNG